MIYKRKEWISGILLLLTLVVNTLGATGFINNMSQKAVSDMFPTLITPAPSTFSIWSVIYSLLIVTIIIMIIKKDDPYYQKVIERTSYLFWLSCVLNMVWIICFSYLLIGLSTIFIFAFTVVLVIIIKMLGDLQDKNRILMPLTFGLYGGWLFIATVVNTAAWLVQIEWGRFGISAEIWSSLILLIAVGLIAFVLTNTKNAILPLPIAWAYFGIYQTLASNDTLKMLANIALVGIVLLIGIAAIQLYKNKYAIMPKIDT